MNNTSSFLTILQLHFKLSSCYLLCYSICKQSFCHQPVFFSPRFAVNQAKPTAIHVTEKAAMSSILRTFPWRKTSIAVKRLLTESVPIINVHRLRLSLLTCFLAFVYY